MAIIPVKIAELHQETPTVRVLRLDLQGQYFSYKAGQWIDCYADIDGVRYIVGYSLASSPTLKGYIELAIKVSDNPVTEYINSRAKVGDTLFVDGGQGDVFYEAEMGSNVVLAAAGIGVAPWMGIVRYVVDATDAEVVLFQSSSTCDELIFFDELKTLALNPRVEYYPFVTREAPGDGVEAGRISGEVMEAHGVDLGALFYLSGPGGMIPELRECLVGRGVDEKRIKYEVWW
jgi:ferredoxin-NADP reductase